MHRRKFLTGLSLLPLSGCALLNIDQFNVFLRSDRILNSRDENAILNNASLSWTKDRKIQVLQVRGTPYEMGYQQGAILREQVRDNLLYLHKNALQKFRMEELFEEVYERMRPFISERYIEEMHGLAHGSRLPLRLIHHIHVLPSIAEWSGKKRLKKIALGEIATSCSNFTSRSDSEKFYVVRVLDWGLHRISKLHEYPLIVVYHPENGQQFVNLTWAGFIGSISGMNASGITIGEKGHGDPENETLRGRPMPFLMRDVLQDAESLDQARDIIMHAPPTNSFQFLISDGKTRKAELYIKDPDRFVVFQPGEGFSDRGTSLPGLECMLYAGHFGEKMGVVLNQHASSLNPKLIETEIIPVLAMKSNFQNVIYDPEELALWVSYAQSTSTRAAEAPYVFFSLKEFI